MTTYPIHERFKSFQGEGDYMGQPAFFIRTYGCPVHCPWCFGKGVKLHTSRGRVDVSQIKVGDLVWSFNEETQKQEWTKVAGIESREVDSYYELSWKVSKHYPIRAKVTGEHPFWVIGRGWVDANCLVPGDIIFEIDSEAYVREMRRRFLLDGKGMSSSFQRKRSSLRMRLDNPVHTPGVREKISHVLKRKVRSGESPNVLKEMWKRKDFREMVIKRMVEHNPNRDPVFHAKSCFRPMGMVSSVERFVADIIEKNGLPFIHNRGDFFVGGRVPDFVNREKKKLVEVTHPTFQDREKNGYHFKNREFYGGRGFECLTLYVPSVTIENERMVLEKLTEFAFNGRQILRKEKINSPLKVYSIRTQNHTFFVEGVLTHNCDSAGTWHPNWVPKDVERMTVDQLIKEADEAGGAFTVITGGEPTIFDLAPLVEGLQAVMPVHLETSGAFPIKGEFDWITLSPKRWKLPLAENLQLANEFKIIVETPEDIGFYLSVLPEPDRRSVWLHPEWSHRNDPQILGAIVEAVQWKGKRTRNVRAGYQLHKLYQVDQKDPRSRKMVPLGGDLVRGY